MLLHMNALVSPTYLKTFFAIGLDPKKRRITKFIKVLKSVASMIDKRLNTFPFVIA